MTDNLKILNFSENDEYHYFRFHEWQGGWGVRRASDSEIVALVFDKNMAAIIAFLLSTYGSQYHLHEYLKTISNHHKILCGAIYDTSDIDISREKRLIKYGYKNDKVD